MLGLQTFRMHDRASGPGVRILTNTSIGNLSRSPFNNKQHFVCGSYIEAVTSPIRIHSVRSLEPLYKKSFVIIGRRQQKVASSLLSASERPHAELHKGSVSAACWQGRAYTCKRRQRVSGSIQQDGEAEHCVCRNITNQHSNALVMECRP